MFKNIRIANKLALGFGSVIVIIVLMLMVVHDAVIRQADANA